MLKLTIIICSTNICRVNIGIFEKFMKCWNAQIEARQTKLSPKLAAMAIEIAGPLILGIKGGSSVKLSSQLSTKRPRMKMAFS
jgi:hypothetical protein